MAGVLVHEWIAATGGSENVLHALTGLYPDADLVCLWNESRGRFSEQRLRPTWLARTPLRRRKAAAVAFMVPTWRLLPYRDYDWALVSSHIFAHHARFVGQPPGFRKLVYVHTPARYVWSPDLDRRGGHPAVRVASSLLRPLDRHRAQEGAEFAANSAFVRERIRRCWGVDARVIHPPVDVDLIQSVPDWADRLEGPEVAVAASLPSHFVLGASRFVAYKRLEAAIDVGEAVGLPVVLAGRGPQLPALRARAATATVPVQILIAPSAALLFTLFQRTALYVFAAVEDFGIMPVEAAAAGAPVLARDRGGTLESVRAGVTGELIDFADPTELGPAADRAMATDRSARTRAARRFAVGRFAAEIEAWVGSW